MKKLSFSILILLSFITLSAKQKVENFNTKQQSLFYPNKGQIIDQDRKVRKDVNYHYSAPGFALSLMDRGMSWTVTKVERFEEKIQHPPNPPQRGNAYRRKKTRKRFPYLPHTPYGY